MTKQPNDIDRVYAQLTVRDLDIIDCLAAHKLLTSLMLTALFFPSRRTASARLCVLTEFGILRRFQSLPSRTYSYTLGWHGHVIAALRSGGRVPSKQSAELETRRLIVSRQRSHLEGINTFMALLHLATSDTEAKVTEWANEAQAAAEFTHLRPDAAATVVFPDNRGLSFWLEYDTATQSLTRLADKVCRYRSGRHLLVVVPSQGRRDNLTATLSPPSDHSVAVAAQCELPWLTATTSSEAARALLTERLWHCSERRVTNLVSLAQ